MTKSNKYEAITNPQHRNTQCVQVSSSKSRPENWSSVEPIQVLRKNCDDYMWRKLKHAFALPKFMEKLTTESDFWMRKWHFQMCVCLCAKCKVDVYRAKKNQKRLENYYTVEKEGKIVTIWSKESDQLQRCHFPNLYTLERRIKKALF